MANVSPYPAEDILDRLLEMQALKDGIYKFFVHDSKFWKALYKYIERCKVGHCPFAGRLTHPLLFHRGTGAVHWMEAHAHPMGAGDDAKNVIRVSFEVSTWDDEYECEREVWGGVDVPIGLITHFEQAEFDAWVAEREEHHRAERLKDAEAKLKALADEYPELGLESGP